MANTYHTVVKGDTLSELAIKYGTSIQKLADLNDIKDVDLIYIGQKLLINGTKDTSKNTSNQCKIKSFGVQSNSTSGRSMFATWQWDKANTDAYNVRWYYDTGDGTWWKGNFDTAVKEKQSLYEAPANAKKVKFIVLPYAKVAKKGQPAPWVGSWSTEKIHKFRVEPPTPSTPNVKIEGTTLTASVDNYILEESYPGAVHMQFQLIKNNKESGSEYKSVSITTGYAECKWTITAGQTQYKVRCRGEYSYTGDGGKYTRVTGEWSGYSGNQGALPNTPKSITECRAMSEDSVYLKWRKSTGAVKYEIEYTDTKSRFDTSTDTQTMEIDATADHAEITGLATGQEYFFRVRAINDTGNSGWTPIKSTKVGSQPGIPTTWSSTTTAVTGEPLSLYWVHNAEDGSSQTYANLELIINGSKQVINIKNSTDEDEKDKTSVYNIDTSSYVEGTQIKWRVQTRGVLAEYSDWSAQRTIDIYAPPTLDVDIADSNGASFTKLTSFPFTISCTAGPDTQTAIGYHITITNDQEYETIDEYGNLKMVVANSSVFSQYYDINENAMTETISANNIDLENNITYTISCTVAMDSGLSADSLPIKFGVAWVESEYWPNMEIIVDLDSAMANIRPYCVDENENLIEGLTMSVYRRSYDGKLIEVGSGLSNIEEIWVTDPHPSLDLARYRIIAREDSTGKISYYDPPGFPVEETSVIIQWDENWSEFDYEADEISTTKSWSGSMIKLPYNIGVTESTTPEVELVNYIGREHPVAYYGTHLGEKGTWNVEIPKEDTETLYALRRLKVWMGNVYVREPSGIGYWATITVQFGQKQTELTIPVTLNITRVEGGL